MGDDAMEIWKREVATGDAAAPATPAAPAGNSEPPPNFTPPPGFFVPRGPGRMRLMQPLPIRFLVPTLLGLGFALLLLLATDVSSVLEYGLIVPPLLGATAAMLTKRGGLEVAGWALIAFLTAGVTIAVVLPLLIFLDFLDCWMSWLSDC